MLEVDQLAQLLPRAAAALSPRALRERLAERLEVVQAAREQERERRADEEVVDVAAQLLVQPGRLVGIEECPVVRVELIRPCVS